MAFKAKGDYATIAWYYPRAIFFTAKKPIYFHLPCGNLFKLEQAYRKKYGKPLSGWGRFIGWKPFFHLYLSSVVNPEYSDGSQPEAIRIRAEADLSKLAFHHSMGIKSRCECDAKAEYPNCDRILKSADVDYMRKLLRIK